MPALHDAELPSFLPALPVAAVSKRRWLQEEILSLASSYPGGEPVADISRRHGRSLAAVYGKARRMGLSRPQRGTSSTVVEDVLPEQVEMALPASKLDLLPPTPANPPFLPPLEMPAAVASPPFLPSLEMPAAAPKPAKPYRVTALGGRQTVWTPDLVRRLILLWVAGFHHTTVAEVLRLTACGVSSKAVRISLPYRAGKALSKDVAAARRTDAMGGEVPKFLMTASGHRLIGKWCNLTGIWFYGRAGTHTCVEAKLTLHYDRMRGSAF